MTRCLPKKVILVAVVEQCIQSHFVGRPKMLRLMSIKICIMAMCCVLFAGLSAVSIEEIDEVDEIEFNPNQTSADCESVSLKILRQVHGPAYDARYMSVDEPTDDEDDMFEPEPDGDRRRHANHRPSFYITDDEEIVLSEKAAWNVDWDTFSKEPVRDKRSLDDHHEAAHKHKRQTQGRIEPWKCEKKVKWLHNADYYPPYLRTIECTKPTCYYNMYDCKPRKFAIRLLRRVRSECADASELRPYGYKGDKKPEFWKWVSTSVNFCCDCVASDKHYKRFGWQ